MNSRLVLFVALLGFLAFSQAAPSHSELSWKLFKAEFSKEYQSEAEEALRMKIFADNVLVMEKHNRRHHAGEVSFEMGINQFSDMLSSEVRSTMNGLKISDKPSQATATSVGPSSDFELPKSVDWRTKGLVTGVKNQGECGSCWAFSTTGSLEGQHAKKTGKLVSLSEKQLLDCSSRFGNEGCHGGLMDWAFKYIKANGGIDTENFYPYYPQAAMCVYSSRFIGATLAGVVKVSPSELELKKAVATVGPVSVAINAASDAFRAYKSGVFYVPDCDNSSTSLDHAVLVVGYGNENGIDYWMVKNSWGHTWGDNGYIKMARNRDNSCGIANMPSYPLV